MYTYTVVFATRKLSIPSLYYVFYHCKVTQYIVLDRIKDIPYLLLFLALRNIIQLQRFIVYEFQYVLCYYTVKATIFGYLNNPTVECLGRFL